MKSALLFTGSGPPAIATSHTGLWDAEPLAEPRAMANDRFAAGEVPQDLAKQCHGGHFDMVMRD
jgi:hypothetical protein